MLGGVDQGPNRKLDSLSVQVADVGLFHESVEQMSGLLKQTHLGIEDYSFNTREEWFESIEKSVRSTRARRAFSSGWKITAASSRKRRACWRS
jgi:putative ABC transport system permease protein